MSDGRCCLVVCKAYKGLRSQMRLERKEAGIVVSPEAKVILDLLDEIVDDICQ